MIKYSIRGENLEVTEAIRDYVVSKTRKDRKILPSRSRTRCTCKFESVS